MMIHHEDSSSMMKNGERLHLWDLEMRSSSSVATSVRDGFLALRQV